MNSFTKTMFSTAVATVAVSVATFTASAPAQALSFALGTSENLGLGPALTANGRPTSVITFPSVGIVPTAATQLSTTNTASNGRAFIQNLNTGFGALNNFYGSVTGLVGLGNGVNVGEFNNGARSVQLTFDNPLNYFGFLWAAPELNDTVRFNFLNGGFAEYTPGTVGINTGLLAGSYINFFSTSASDIISNVVFRQTGAGGFNVRNAAYQAIPTPALLPGLLALGATALRKRKAEAAAEA